MRLAYERWPLPKRPFAQNNQKIVALMWLIPVLLTMLKASPSAILAGTSAAFAACAWAQLSNSRSLPFILPFIALLSPITGFFDLGGASFLYSDLLFPLLAVQASVIVVARPIQRIPKLLSLLGLAFVIATIFGVAIGLAWLKPVLYLLQILLVVFFTLRAVKDYEDLAALRNAWTAAALMGSALLLHAYVEGRPLVLSQDEAAVVNASAADLGDLFRSSYYYTNFHYVLGLCAVWAGLRLFFPSTNSHRMWTLASLSVLVLSLISSVNKTALIGAILALVLTVVLLFHCYPRNMSTATARFSLPAIIVLGAVASSLIQFASNQIDFIGARLTGVSSLLIRLEVFQQALSTWVSYPLNALLGYGPSLLDGSSNTSLSQLFKFSAVTGYAEGALDSAWLSYLVELGLLGTLLLAALFARGIVNSLRGLRNCPRFDECVFAEASMFGGLVFLVIAMFTQMIGYSKISWLPLQLLVVAAIGLRRTPE